MTYKKPQKFSINSNKEQVDDLETNKKCNQDVNEQQNNQEMNYSNGQVTFKEKRDSEWDAQARRDDSSIRHDVLITSDVVAVEEMLRYIECDENTVDYNSESDIVRFYAGRCVFITGASGFVGKVGLADLFKC